MRKTTIIVSSFLIGIATTVFAAATYDASIQTRATTMFNAIKSNASAMDPLDVSAYYNLVHLNITTLMQVLTTLDAKVLAEMGSSSDLQDDAIINQIATPGTNTNTTTSSNTANNGASTVGSNTQVTQTPGISNSTSSTNTSNTTVAVQKVTIKVSAGTNISCGDPSRSDYLAWSDANWQTERSTVIDKVYCNQKGGYIWATCDRVVTNKKSIDTLKEGDKFSCPVKQVTTTTTTNAGVTGATAAGSASTNTTNQSSSAVGTLEVTRTPAISTGLVVEGTSYLVTWKVSGNIQKVSYSCKVNGVEVVGTTGLSSVERIQGSYTTKMIGTNYCEWVGHDATGNTVTKTYEQFVVREKSPDERVEATSTEKITVTASNGVIACGNPEKNTYTTYSPINNKVILDKAYCNQKGLNQKGYVWIMCSGKATSIKSVDTTKDGDTFSCPTVTTTTTTPNTTTSITIPTVKTSLTGLVFDKASNTVRFTVGNYTKYSMIMFETNNNQYGTVLQCYYFEKNDHMSPHCLMAEKISGDYTSSSFTLKLSPYAIENGVNRNTISAYIPDLGEYSGYKYVASDKVVILSPVGIATSLTTPVFNLVRTNLNDGQNVEWTTSNVKTLSYSCVTNGGVMNGDVELNRAKTFTSWTSFHNAGWPAGKYICTWKVVGDSSTLEKTEDFVIL